MTEVVELLKPNTVVGVRFQGTSTTVYDYTTAFMPENAAELKYAVVLVGDHTNYDLGNLKVVEIVRARPYDPATDKGLKPVAVLFSADNCALWLSQKQRREHLESELRKRVAKRSLEMNFEALLQGDEVGMQMLREYMAIG